MYLLSTNIEISASHEAVREKFLDFSQIPTYHPRGFLKIGAAVPNEPLKLGDKMHNVIGGMTFYPILVENSPACFRWDNRSPYGILGAEHIFRFEPSTKTQGATMFIHEEKFTGFLAFLMGDSFVSRLIGFREKTKMVFKGYNQDLKVWCEGSKGAN